LPASRFGFVNPEPLIILAIHGIYLAMAAGVAKRVALDHPDGFWIILLGPLVACHAVAGLQCWWTNRAVNGGPGLCYPMIHGTLYLLLLIVLAVVVSVVRWLVTPGT
jgi:hypothetical protein